MAVSVFGQVLDAVRDAIVALALDGIPDDRIVLLSVPRPTDQAFTTLPVIAIAPLGAETIAFATNLQDDYIYPVLVAIVDDAKNRPLDETALDGRLVWRDSIAKEFHNTRMSVVTGIVTQVVQPLPAVDPGWWGQGYFVSAMIVRITVRKGRT